MYRTVGTSSEDLAAWPPRPGPASPGTHLRGFASPPWGSHLYVAVLGLMQRARPSRREQDGCSLKSVPGADKSVSFSLVSPNALSCILRFSHQFSWSEGRFHSEALDTTRPGALPAPYPTTHLPTLSWWRFPSFAAKLVGLQPTESGFPWLKGCVGPWLRLQEGVQTPWSLCWGRGQPPAPVGPPACLRGGVPNSLMWGWGGGPWGLDGWFCFFICAIVWTILKLHVKGEISIWRRRNVKS